MSAPAGGDKKNIVKMAYIYFQEGRWDKAIEEYRKLIALDPEDINTHNMLGDVYVKKGSGREAFEEYMKVSTDFSSRGQTDKAVIVNKKIAALDASLLPAEAQKKQNLIKQTLKAETAMEQGDMDVAIEALTEVLKLDAENLAAFYKLGELYEKKGQTAEAVKHYQMLGGAFLKNRLFKKAQEVFQKVVLLDPNNIEARVNLAQIHIKQGSESDAKKEYLNAAEQALDAGDLENANAYAAKAVELKSIEAHYVLGMVLFKKQKLSEAKSEFESLLRFKVNHVGALTNLGRVLLELGQADKAAENIQKALKLEKDNMAAVEAWVEVCLKKGNKPEAVTNLGILIDHYASKNDHAKAAEFARALLSLDENSMTAHSKLSEALRQSGDKNAAAEAYFKLALAHEKQGKKDPMMEAVRKALELNPNHSEAQKRLMGEVTAGAPAPTKPAEPAPAAAAPSPKPEPAAPKTPAAGVLDLEQEIVKPFSQSPKAAAALTPAPAPAPIATPVPALVHSPSAPAAEADPQEELRAQLSIADNYLKQGMVEEAIEVYQQLAEAHPESAEVKQKLNQAYTAYVKTGEDVIGALEAEKKAKEEEEIRLRAEMEKKAQEEAKRLREELEMKARQEADRQVRAELEKKAREEAEKKAKEEMERMVRAEAERRQKDEMEKRLKDEAMKKAHEEIEHKVREETERKVRDEMERKARDEAEKKARDDREKAAAAGATATSRTPPPSKGDALEDNRDEFMTIAVADIYVRQGLLEEAAKIYRRITQGEPDNLEARKKLGDVEAMIKAKGGSTPEKQAAPSATGAAKAAESQAAPPAAAPPASRPPEGEKDSGGKKKSNRVGYV